MSLRTIVKKVVPQRIIDQLKNSYEKLCILSLQKAVHEQGLHPIYNQLSEIVPNLEEQYTTFDINTPYLETKVRALHSFQIFLIKKTLRLLQLEDSKSLTIVDIGDSAGTHLQYLKSLFGNFHSLSVNLDEAAVQKIKKKGLDAIHARAEELDQYNIGADIFLSFETLEHVFNPASFLHDISQKTSCKVFIVTVPYLYRSRVALHHIRHNRQEQVFAENTHLFELSPTDWKLIFQHSGWSIEYDQIFFQYPRRTWLRIMKNTWKHSDFEGFYGAVLIRDNSWSDLYQDW